MARGPSLVLFDLDETLFDHRHASRVALDALRRRHAALAAVPLAELEGRARHILERVHGDLLAGRLSAAEARLERLRALFTSCGEDPADAFLDCAAGEYGVVYRSARRSAPGARRLLERLRDDSKVECVGVVTNHLAEIQKEKLAACGLAGLVDFMVTSEEVGCLKPAAEVFEAALDRGGAGAADAVMVGDSWEGDVSGAAAVGIRAVWYNPLGRPRPPGWRAAAAAELVSFNPPDEACRVILSR